MADVGPDLSASELASGFASGAFSPSEICTAVIGRIAEREPVINAFYRCDPDAAQQAAAASTRRWASGRPLGPLDGVPVTVKENIARQGIPMPSGTALPNPPVALANAPVTDRILEAGGVLLGSTVMPDWGMLSSGVSSRHGISRSPWNPAWTTGGSSAGAGAAAAAGFGPLHVGTDIGGSVRLPGTWLGLATLKPSAGRVPLDVPYAGRAAGPMARTVRDAGLLMSVIGQFDARDYSTRPYPAADWRSLGAGEPEVARLRVAVQLDAGAGAPVDAEVAAAVRAVAERFAEAGADVGPLGPVLDQAMLDGLDNFWRIRAFKDFRALDEAGQALLLPYIARWCAIGARFDGADALACYETIGRVQQATVAATWAYDVVLSPVAPMAAFAAEKPMPNDDPEATMDHIAFTVPYNMSGQPAATVNCGFSSDGRPIGVQIAGRVGDDLGVLKAAAWYEANRPATAVPDWAGLAQSV